MEVYIFMHSHIDASLFSLEPVSLNVSLGATVLFVCETPHDNTSLFQLSAPSLDGPRHIQIVPLPGGGQRTTLSFTATADRNETEVVCQVFTTTLNNTPPALLLIQGIAAYNIA